MSLRTKLEIGIAAALDNKASVSATVIRGMIDEDVKTLPFIAVAVTSINDHPSLPVNELTKQAALEVVVAYSVDDNSNEDADRVKVIEYLRNVPVLQAYLNVENVTDRPAITPFALQDLHFDGEATAYEGRLRLHTFTYEAVCMESDILTTNL